MVELGTSIIKFCFFQADYAKKKQLGGLMFWTLDGDDFNGKCTGLDFPIVRAGKYAFLNQ